MLPGPHHSDSLPLGRYELAPLTGNKEESMGLTVLWVRPTTTRFPTSILGYKKTFYSLLSVRCSDWYASTNLPILTLNRTTAAIVSALQNYRCNSWKFTHRDGITYFIMQNIFMIFLLPFQEPILCIVFGLSLRETKMVVKGVRNTAISLAICILVGKFKVEITIKA